MAAAITPPVTVTILQPRAASDGDDDSGGDSGRNNGWCGSCVELRMLKAAVSLGEEVGVTKCRSSEKGL